MDSNKKRYIDFFDQTAYIPPNDIPDGYALIGPMLYIFPRIAIHSPASKPIELSDSKFPNTTLLLEDYEYLLTNKDNKLGKPVLIPTAFETFTLPEYRQSLQSDFQIRTDFDEQFVDESSLIYGEMKIIPDKRLEVSQNTIDFVQSTTIVENQILAHLKYTGEYYKLNSRLENYREQRAVLEPIKLIIDAPNPQRVVIFSVYNFFNNNLASATAAGNVDIISKEHRIVAESIHGMNPVFLEFEQTNQYFDEKVIHAILGEVCLLRKKPITVEQIFDFRDNYRDLFLSDIYDILEEVYKYKNDSDKIIQARRMAREKLDKYKLPSKIVKFIARTLSVCSSGVVKEEEIVTQLNKILDLYKPTRDWKFGLLKNPPSSRVTGKTKREILDGLDALNRL